MKVLIVFCFFGFGAFASEPLITQVNIPGRTSPELTLNETCSIYADHIDITHAVGQHPITTITETHPLSLSGDIDNLISLVSKEAIKVVNSNVCDGPSTIITLYPSTGDEVQLYQTGKCNSPMKQRQGVSSTVLRKLISSDCSLVVY